MFLIAVFFLKNRSGRENSLADGALSYENVALGELVNRDTDSDGIVDWEENLWGTDPKKKDTDGNGISDDIEIKKQKSETTSEGDKIAETENLSKTEKLSRELFSTLTALNQNGAMDDATVEALSNSILGQIEHSPQKKVFLLSELKISQNNTPQSVEKYRKVLSEVYTKYSLKRSVVEILEELLEDEENLEVLNELDPVINQANKIISELVNTEVPALLANEHLKLINTSQKISENMSDIKFFDTDIIVAISAVGQYEKNSASLEFAAANLLSAINEKLEN